jgi:hypothetical protein
MSGIDQFLAQHYGTVPTEPSQEDLQKVAQAELFLKLAANNGVDINQLNDAQINELWGQVFGEEKLAEAAQLEHEFAKAAAAEAQEKFAEADYMGRIMAHSYVNELRGIAAEGGLDFMKIAEEAKTHWLRRGWEAVKHQATGRGHFGPGWQKLKKDDSGKRQVWEGVKELGKGVGHAAVIPGSVAAVGAGGYGVHRLLKKKDEGEEESKESSALDTLAANYAVEKAAAYGYDPEEAAERIGAVLTLGPDESDKVAYVANLDDAVDVRSSELLELAGYPIDWSGTPFEKMAAEGKPGILRRGWERGKELLTGSKIEDYDYKLKDLKRLATAPYQSALGRKRYAKQYAKAHAAREGEKRKVLGARIGTGVAGVGVLGGGGYGIHRALRKKDEGEEESKESSVRFDNAAAELAVEKAAEAGWDASEAIERLNSLFTLGYEGDPTESAKVAYAQTGDQALTLRAMELLELAGYPINW